MTDMPDSSEEATESLAAGAPTDGSTDPVAEVALNDGPTEVEQLQSKARRVMLWTSFGVVAIVIAAGLLIKVDYVTLVPGSARDTEPLVVVEGTDDFPSDGEILYTTVRVRQEPNVFEYFLARFDDDAEILPAQQVLGDLSPEENREVNLQLMSDSKAIAIAVALEELGYDTITSDGVIVADVVPDTAADGVLQLGDTVLAVNGEAVPTALDLIAVLRTYSPGSTLTFEVQRWESNDVEEIDVVMGAREDDPEAAFLGISPQDRVSLLGELPLDVEIDSGSVGGPSAGLAFTLAILDQLTPGELTGNNDVAVTGTIAFDGRVGPVGGVVQKTAAVREMGLNYFIVPASLGEETLEAMRARAGDDLEIIPVDTLEEALAALERIGGDVDAISDYEVAQP